MRGNARSRASSRDPGTRRFAFASPLVIALALAACVAPAAGAPSASNQEPVPSADATVRQPSAPPCGHSSLFLEPPAPTMANARDGVPTVVVGTFQGFGDAHWATKDGARPRANLLDALIVTDARISVERVVRGSEDDALHAATPGGTVGCDSLVSDYHLPLRVGGRYAFFLAPLEYRHFNILFAWPVTADGMVETPLEGRRPLEDLNEDIPPPTPWPTVEATAGP